MKLASLLLAVTIAAPGTVTTVVKADLLAGSGNGVHLHGIVRDPVTGDIYVGDWNAASTGTAPFFAPYVENKDAVWRINQLGEAGVVAYALSPNAMTFHQGDRGVYVLVGGVSCDAATRAPVPEFNGIVAIDPATGTSRFVSGGPSGFANAAPRGVHYGGAAGLAADPRSGALYVAEGCRNRIRMVDVRGMATTLAGSGATGSADGTGASATFNDPHGLAYCARSSRLYVADTGNDEIRAIDADGRVSTIAGSTHEGFTDGRGSAARFDRPTGVACDDADNVYVADSQNNAVRKIDIEGVVTTVAGTKSAGNVDGVGNAVRFSTPGDLTYDPAEKALYVVDWGSNDIRKIALGAP